LAAKLLGVYPNDGPQAAGMPGDASAHPNPSAAPVPVQPDPQETSFWPVVLTHLPLVQLPSLVQ
jgi:hypothetical protein